MPTDGSRTMSVEGEKSHGEVLYPGCSDKYELKSVAVPKRR